LTSIFRIRTFVFAGHDTISTSISMIFYYLSKNPSVRAKACAELDAVFTPSLSTTASRIREDPYILNQLPYNHAVMKEALRLFPPANTVRIGSPNVQITDPKTGQRFPTHDWVVWPDSYVIGRSEIYYPDAEKFMPERWLPESSFPAIPPGAFRAFERGPRNCIGSEFGTLEIKVVMAMTLRDFDFVPAYPEDSLKVDGEPCYQMLFGSAKPKSSVPGRIVRTKRGDEKNG
jgi:cytochrome P450